MVQKGKVAGHGFVSGLWQRVSPEVDTRAIVCALNGNVAENKEQLASRLARVFPNSKHRVRRDYS